MEVKPLQPEKQPSSIDVTDEGISMEVKPLQSPKHPLLNEVIDEGIFMEVIFLQSENVLLVDYQYFTL